MTAQLLRILSSILTIVIGLWIGLLLRRRLVRRLKKTVLDAWLIQTLGILVILPSLAVASFIVPVILTWGQGTLGSSFDTLLQRYKIEPLQIGQNLAASLIIVGLGIGAARTIQALVIRGLSERRIDINIRTFIGRVFYILTIIIAIFWILAVWNISVGIPVAAFGIVTAAVVVSIQDVLKDLVAGLYILLERPFYIGNVISISTYLGHVEDIQLRATKLRLVTGEEVSIPNSMVFGGTVMNTSYYGERRATIKVDIPQDHFVATETTYKLLQTVKEVEGVMEKPEPTALFASYAEQKMTLTVRFWVATNQNNIISDVMYALHRFCPEATLTVTEPAGNV